MGQPVHLRVQYVQCWITVWKILQERNLALNAFATSHERNSVGWTNTYFGAQVSYMEIYNEALYDLLGENPAASENLSILEDSNGTYVSKLFQIRS